MSSAVRRRIGLAQEAFDLLAILELDRADAERRRECRDEAAEGADRQFPDLDLDRPARRRRAAGRGAPADRPAARTADNGGAVRQRRSRRPPRSVS